MFFDLETGEESNYVSGPSGPQCWIADSNIWFDAGGAGISLNGIDIEEFSSFLEKTSSTQEYLELPEKDGFRISLEEEDEDTRNLCFSSKQIFVNFNVQLYILQKLATFLRAESKVKNEN